MTQVASIRLIEEDLSGGCISKARIDSIDDFASTRLEISGLRQDTFEYLIDKYGRRFREIRFFKCPKIEDLSPLESLSEVQVIDYYWNQKCSRLWNLALNPCLTSLTLQNFKRLTDLSDLGASGSLEHLEFGNSPSGTTHVDSLEPIGSVHTLQSLAFNPKRIVDGRAEPLTRLPNLKMLKFSNRLFTTEKIAWLTARLKPNIESSMLAATTPIGRSMLPGKDTMVVGKGKPCLSSSADKDLIAAYVTSFESLVARYRSDPACAEPV